VIYLVDLRLQPLDRQLLAVSLQGVLNASARRPFVYVRLVDNDPRWLEAAQQSQPPLPVQVSIDELFEKFRGYIGQQILYDPALPHTINLATIFAGLEGAVITPRDLGLKTIYDFRDRERFGDRYKAYRWAVEEALPRCCSDRVAVLDTGLPHLRDYLIAQRIFTVDLDPLNDPQDIALLKSIFSQFPPSATVLGWASGKYARQGQDGVTVENAFIALLSEYGHHLVASDFIPNLSFHQGIRVRTRFRPHLTRVYGPEKVYVTFLMSDGDNAQFDYNRMLDLWRDADRGKVPLGWTISPALMEMAPDLLAKYIQDAASSAKDDLVMGPSGYGYCNPARLAHSEKFFALTGRAAKATGISAAAIIDYESAAKLREIFRRMGSETGLQGFFLIRHGIEGIFGRLAVADEDIRFGGQSPEELARQIEQAGARNRFIFVYVDAWSRTPHDIVQAVRSLPQRYVVVGPYDFLRLMKTAKEGRTLCPPNILYSLNKNGKPKPGQSCT